MTPNRTQTIARLESQGFRWVDDDSFLTVEKDDWEKTYIWPDVSIDQIISDYMAFVWADESS